MSRPVQDIERLLLDKEDQSKVGFLSTFTEENSIKEEENSSREASGKEEQKEKRRKADGQTSRIPFLLLLEPNQIGGEHLEAAHIEVIQGTIQITTPLLMT